MKNKYSAEALRSQILISLKGLEAIDSICQNNNIETFDLPLLSNSPKVINEKYYQDFENSTGEIKSYLIRLYQDLTIYYPKIYMYRTRKNKNDTFYFNAKVSWILKNGDKKEIAVYVGKAEDFNNDTANEVATEIAIRKLRELLINKRELGEI